MPANSTFSKRTLLVLGDIIACLLALSLALAIRYGGAPGPTIIRLYEFVSPLLVALWLSGLLMFGLYDAHLAKNEPRFFERLTRALVFDLIATALLFYFIPAFRLRPLASLVIIFITLAAFLFAWRGTYNALLVRRRKERLLFIGISDEALELSDFLVRNPQLGFVPAAYVRIDGANGMPAYSPGIPVFGPERSVEAIVREYHIGRIIVTHDVKRTGELARALFPVLPLGVGIADFPRFYESVRGKVPVSLISEGWFIENLIGQRRPRYEFAKRILDLIIVLIFGAITLVLLPFIAIAIFLSTPRDIMNHARRRAREGDGIIFFRQQRVGRNGNIFNFVKFRSQILGAERFGGEKLIGQDPRTYAVGTFLRKTYLDELPQLWNVLAGDMSFVGPRPERPEFVRELERNISFYRMRELVTPGITGWAQVNMENDASVSDAPEKMQYDLYYIKNRTIFLDIAILIKTALKLLQRSGK